MVVFKISKVILNLFSRIVNYVTRVEKSLICKFVPPSNDKFLSSELKENSFFTFLDLYVRNVTKGF
jgi:hypothetical protein